jgi:hypothetical protein
LEREEVAMQPKTDHEILLEIYNILIGTEDRPGLCKDVNDLKKFKTNVIIVFSFLVGTGLVSFGILELLKL